VDREVPIQVTVPAGTEQPAQWVIAFSNTIIATVPSAAKIPSGCSLK
jgi:hypothetical protein